MSGRNLRRVAAATAAALLIGSWAVAPASALVPPGGTSSTSICQTRAAGYSPFGIYKSGSWEWDGRLKWDLCVVRTGSGAHYAIVRLSSPSRAALYGQYDRYTGLVHIKIQKCSSGTYTTVGSTDWAVEGHETAVSEAGDWYHFRWLQTSGTTSSVTSYRVRIEVVLGAVVPRNGGWYFSLHGEGYPPGPVPPEVTNSGCMAP
jgi:hypothetical protein